MSKPSIPKGTRDFLPCEVFRRKYIFSVIEEVFTTFGYLPIETPTMESLQTLTGKYGEEGDRLLFKILNNGDFLQDVDSFLLEEKNSAKLIAQISKRGLRYDLTVPFARFVVMYRNNIQLPFKRYQIQPVWRADRPQRGRYQEFYQCDVDVVGSESLMYEAELMQIYHQVFKKLGIKVNIRINNRKILFGLAEAFGITEQFIDMTISIDKLDKIGYPGVLQEMINRGITQDTAEKVIEVLKVKHHSELKDVLKNTETGIKGIEEIDMVYQYLENTIDNLSFDITLARGLNYYTGCIFEVVIDAEAYPGFSMGSIGGGGRYDNLTGTFGMPGVSGVGVSFGAERIYDVMHELNLFPQDVEKNIRLLMVALDEKSHQKAFLWLTQLRKAGIASDLYPEPAKMKKQLGYANDRNIPYVAIIGEAECASQTVSLKNMVTGEQKTIPVENLWQTPPENWLS